MKRLFFTVFIVFMCFNALAQLEVVGDSFKEIPGFVNQNAEIYDDDNNVPYAVIKVRTENFSVKQRRQLLFQGNAATYIELEYKQDEIWVYLSSIPATYLKISHPDLGSTEFKFPFDLKPQKGYEMVLENKTRQDSSFSILHVITKPESGASIALNGRTLSQLTPYTNDMLPPGKYIVSVSKERYETVTKTINIKAGESLTVEMEMPAKHGKVRITSVPQGAKVFIDNEECGVTPCEKEIIIGPHDLRVSKEGWTTVNRQFVLKEKGFLKTEITMAKCPEGALSGFFSINSKDKVVFSKGNLQYNSANGTWRFADRQFDYLCEANKISSGNSGWIDLFAWGSGNSPLKESKNRNDYWRFIDWADNYISNGGGRAIDWRTLDMSCWDYLLESRETQSGVRFVKAMVNDVAGLVLLPDNWCANWYEFQKSNDLDAGCETNVISLSDWTNKIEANGAVFLPAAGLRDNGAVSGCGLTGNYWSLEKIEGSGYIKGQYLTFSKSPGTGYKGYHFCWIGMSARLVTPANEIISEGSYGDDVLEESLCGMLKVTSEPSGATVMIDDKICGVTPCEIEDVAAGSHVLSITKQSYISSTREVTAEVGKILELNEKLEKGLDGATKAVYSISKTRKVRFSKGNLQYNASTKIWRFAPHQWDIVGEERANELSNGSGWRDLFGWGTGRNPMNTSGEAKSYGVFDDWGKNSISNGGNTPNAWRTMANYEWEYLLKSRKTKSGVRFALATVNDVPGMIILPDSWDKKAYKLNKANKVKAGFSDNVISKDDWNKVFEAEGAVFLPTAGMRSYMYNHQRRTWESSIMWVSQKGSYWTSSPCTYNNSGAEILDFQSDICYPHDFHYGFPVRLVCDVE